MSEESEDTMLVCGLVEDGPSAAGNSSQVPCSFCGRLLWATTGSLNTAFDAQNRLKGGLKFSCFDCAPEIIDKDVPSIGEEQIEELLRHGIDIRAAMKRTGKSLGQLMREVLALQRAARKERGKIPAAAKPGDPAPGGGLIGGIGDRDQFLKMIVGKQVNGAIPCGRRVRKVNSEPQDRTPDGVEGEILGSIAAPGHEPIYVKDQIVVIGYLIKWDKDATPIFTIQNKLEEL